MKAVVSAALLFATLVLFSEAVQVQDGEYFFSAESVKVLQGLLDSSSATQQKSPRLATTSYASVCANPTLPQEFVPICNQSGSSLVFSRLAAMPMDVCEICAFAACTGC
ncbi:guanylin family protein [Colossoma macropomum]|uniref:guanylin family protein n=1 Tax=Colossoma macropomum TaxID=42526 RepID=UPI0018648AB7|nr:guanylin family protein [Colossoma macropomum]